MPTIKAYGQMNQVIEFVTQERTQGLQALEVNEGEASLNGQGLVSIEVNFVDESLMGQALAQIIVAEGSGFILLADLIQSELAGTTLGAYASQRINARLRVDDVVVPITSFNYQVPTGRLGSLLNVRLAEKDIAAVPTGASVDFEIVIDEGLGSEAVYKLMDNGKLSGRSSQVSWRGGKNAGPTDEITFSAMDVIADKFSLAPRRPVIMFDPIRVKYDEVNTTDIKEAMRDELGGIILPVLEPVGGLKLMDVMKRAYTQRGGLHGLISGAALGQANQGWISGLMVSPSNDQKGMDFVKVVTNITNYPVKRADFPVEASWHDGVRPFVDMLAPVYFAEGTTLFVLDVEKKLPYAISLHQVSLSTHKRLTEAKEFTPDKNAVILTYQYSGSDVREDEGQKLRREVFRRETDITGVRGQPGYVERVTERWDYEYYLASDPTNILDTLPKSTEITTYQTIFYTDEAGIPFRANKRKMTHQETCEYSYEGELKVGHDKHISATIPTPISEWTGSALEVRLRMKFMPILHETCTVQWSDDPKNHGTKIQQWSKIETNGVCYVADETEELFEGDSNTPLTILRLYPALELMESGRVTTDMAITSITQPITTETETLHNNKNVFEVERIEINHLSNTIRTSTVDTRAGGTTSVDPYATRTRNVLYRDLVSEALIGPRVPVSINAYELPREDAIALAQRVLKRLNNPPTTLPLDIPGVDFVIQRGTVFTGQRRDGTYTDKYIVTGYSISGENLGKSGHRISQSVESLELLAD